MPKSIFAILVIFTLTSCGKSYKDDYDAEISKNQKLQEQIDELTSKLSDAEDEIDKKKGRISELEDIIDQAADEANDLKTSLLIWEDEPFMLNGRINNLINTLDY